MAYERLRADITAGRWLPDTILSTYGLSEELGMSRTPIIAALKRLEADGLIEIIPQVGCRVLRRAREEISETFMIRAVLEALAAEVAAPRLTERELTSLREVVEAGEAAAAAGDAERYETADRAFHAQLLAASRMADLQRIVTGLWTLTRYELASSRFIGERMPVSAREHRAIFEALEARDSAEARRTTESHLRSCSRDYARFVEAHAKADDEAAAADPAGESVPARG